jgi:flagellar basal body P-ring formation protein FlgA
MMLRLFILIILGFLMIGLQPAQAAYDPALMENTQTESRMLFQLTNVEAESAIAQALADKGAGDHINARILGRKNDVIFSYNKPVVAEIHGLRFEKRTHRWNASILFRSGEDVVSAIPASGSYEEMIAVPVLKREVRNDAVITPEDIEMRDFPMAQTRSDTIVSQQELLGKSPLRYISAQRPIRNGEIAMPAVVRKNSMIQIRFVSEGLHITTVGQALQDGAMGEVINVRNNNSKRVIRAIVENQGTVRVVTPGSLPNASVTRNDTQPVTLTGGAYATN